MTKRENNNGRFARVHNKWSPTNMEDGYVDSSGRFRVYLPEHHRSFAEGYVLRAIVHYEYYNNMEVPGGYVVHHVDGNRLNDTKENLIILPFGKHTQFHRIKRVECTCKKCGKPFLIKPHKLKEKGRGSYCSQECYQKRGVSEETRKRMSIAQIRRRHG